MPALYRRLAPRLLAFVFCLLCWQGAVAADRESFSNEQLEQLVAPIALYPDSLVAQILMAATYPLEIVEADRWRQGNLKLAETELERQLQGKEWDPSVVSLTYFPDVLHRLSENLDWTQDLGDAVLAQQDQVMDAIQRMRKHARDAGNLETTEKQVVIVEPTTEIVYVPTYNPTVIYGSYWVVPHYHYPIYSYPAGYWASNMISFGLGVAVGRAMWGSFDWGRRDININVNHNHWSRRDVNINRNGTWQHNTSHRRSVRYKDQTTRDRFQAGNRATREQAGARGFDSSRRDVSSLQKELKKAGEARDRKPSVNPYQQRERNARDKPRQSMARDAGGANRKPVNRDAATVGGGGRDRQGGASNRGNVFSSTRSADDAGRFSNRGASSRASGGGRAGGGLGGGAGGGGRLGGGR